MKAAAADRIRRRLVRNPEGELNSLLRRLACQLDFARAFAPVVGLDVSPIEAADRWLEEFNGDVPALRELVTEIETSLADIGQAAKAHTIHLVGHGHIDMNWMWSWPETAATTHDTFASVLSFMRQYPEFTYSQSQASVYALVEEYYPDMFEEIRQRVQEGRWEVAAAHWVEGDKNIASGESLAHHLLYTRRYFQEKFGLSPEDVPVDWEPDTFGHANTIPSILRQGAVKYYYSCRTGGGHHHDRVGPERPPVFWWEGPDGSRVLVNRETTWYNSYINIGDNYALPMVGYFGQTGLHHWLDVYGVGNHGGGPTRDEIEYYLESREWPIWPNVQFSTSKTCFEAMEREITERQLDIPVFRQELNFEFTGCYTSQSAIKRANRFGENYCEEAETLAALVPDANVPRLQDAWTRVLFNQFHDILPGSGVAATREHALGLFQEVGAITGAAKRTATKAWAGRIDTLSLLPDTPEGREERDAAINAPFQAGAGLGSGLSGFSQANGGGRRFFPVVVYNPCAWERSEVVEAHLYDHDLTNGRIVALGKDGRAAPTMVTSQTHEWGHRKTTLIFPAEGIPALGYKTFLLCEGEPSDSPKATVLAETEIATPHLTLKFDRYGSGFRVTSDPEGQLGTLGRWHFVNERPRGMTSWVLGGLTDAPLPLPSAVFGLTGSHRNEGTDLPGGSSFAYIVTNRMEVPGTHSSVTTRAVVQSLSRRVDIEADVDWREIGDEKRGIPGLVLNFGVNTRGEHAVYETPFGTIDRDLGGGEEVPTLRFAHLPENGITILQDSKYGHARTPQDLQMRIVRSSFDPDHAPEVGRSKLRYSVVFHDGEPTCAELVRLGAEFNHPLIVFPATLQQGDLPAQKSFAKVLTPDVVLSGLKKGEDGGLVLRLVNYATEDVQAEVELDESLAKGTAQTVDLLERAVGEASLDGSSLRVAIPANSFVTVRLA